MPISVIEVIEGIMNNTMYIAQELHTFSRSFKVTL